MFLLVNASPALILGAFRLAASEFFIHFNDLTCFVLSLFSSCIIVQLHDRLQQNFLKFSLFFLSSVPIINPVISKDINALRVKLNEEFETDEDVDMSEPNPLEFFGHDAKFSNEFFGIVDKTLKPPYRTHLKLLYGSFMLSWWFFKIGWTYIFLSPLSFPFTVALGGVVILSISLIILEVLRRFFLYADIYLAKKARNSSLFNAIHKICLFVFSMTIDLTCKLYYRFCQWIDSNIRSILDVLSLLWTIPKEIIASLIPSSVIQLAKLIFDLVIMVKNIISGFISSVQSIMRYVPALPGAVRNVAAAAGTKAKNTAVAAGTKAVDLAVAANNLLPSPPPLSDDEFDKLVEDYKTGVKGIGDID